MASREHVRWPIPRSPWEIHTDAVHEIYRETRFYAGIEAEQIVLLWERFEETGASPRPGHTGTSPHTNEKSLSETPLENEEKVVPQVRLNVSIADRLRGYADKYDVAYGVLLGYILREYYETDGWGFDRRAVGSETETDADAESVPYGESEKADWIAERIALAPDEPTAIHADDVREVIETAGAASRAEHYLSLVIDRLDYVHDPNAENVYIPRAELRERGISPSDAPYYRKPFGALSREEKIEGIVKELNRMNAKLTVGKIHERIFDGKGSRSHIRDLVHAVVERDDFEYRSTIGGTKLLCPLDPDSLTKSESEPEDTTDAGQDRERREEIEADAAERMDQLESAAIATDGGASE